MYSFSDFINDVKTNRESEMVNLRRKGYKVLNNYYKFTDSFVVNYSGKQFYYQLFCVDSISFLSINSSADDSGEKLNTLTTYLSLSKLIDEIEQIDTKNVVSEFITKSDKDIAEIIYINNIYALPVPSIEARQFKKLKSSVLCERLMLLFLIQNKSNLFFSRKKEYIDGIYRFYNIHRNFRYNSIPMAKRGWTIEDATFHYRDYLEFRAVVVVFKGKTGMTDEQSFIEKIKKSNSNFEILNIFLDEHNKSSLYVNSKDAIENSDVLKHIMIKGKSNRNVRIFNKIKALREYGEDADKFYTATPLSLSYNIKMYILLLNKFNKKYYLTEQEMNDIIKLDPSNSPINDGSSESAF